MITRVAGKYGRRAAEHDPRIPRLADYLHDGTALTPTSYDAVARVYSGLRKTEAEMPIERLYPMLDNDEIGDCVVAEWGHHQTTVRGIEGKLAIITAADARATYFAQTGGQDTGLVISQWLRYCHQHALYGDRLPAFAAVNVKDQSEIERALVLFGALVVGFNTTTQTIPQFEAGQIWTPGTPNGDGHCIHVTSYSPSGVGCITWAARQEGTWEWWESCVDEAYVTIWPEMTAKNFTGLNVAQLIVAMHQLAA